MKVEKRGIKVVSYTVDIDERYSVEIIADEEIEDFESKLMDIHIVDYEEEGG